MTKKLTAKEQAAIEYYTEPTSKTYNNWSQSYLRANYSRCHGWGQNAVRVLVKPHIKNEIQLRKRKIAKQTEVSRQYCIEKLTGIAETSKDERVIISAISTIGDFAGFKRELAPNDEKEKARKALLDKELKALQELARRRTHELSQPRRIESEVIDAVP